MNDLAAVIYRRKSLFAKLSNNSVALIASGGEAIRNRDVEYSFRANSDFHYLTGFDEPDCILVLHKTLESENSYLFLREKDPLQETWQGRRLGVDKAPDVLKLNAAWSIDDLDVEVLTLLENIAHIYCSFSELENWNVMVASWIKLLKDKVRQGVTAPSSLNDLDVLLHEIRLIKSNEEINIMRQAAKISVQGHLAAMKFTKPGKFEYQVQAELEHSFKINASPRVAFNTIAASGENACILHYTENSSQLEDGQLLLLDAGAEYQGYAGDITTTFPVSGKFTDPQATLYSLVLQAQQAAFVAIKPNYSYDDMHLASSQVITQGLLDLGILSGDFATLMQDKSYKTFFMHGTGHWLGRDVHDVGNYKIKGKWRNFVAGMVVTVEPGIYIAPDDVSVDKKWRGIGIRIEDDVLVTPTGYEILTKGLPRTVKEIEQWMSNR